MRKKKIFYWFKLYNDFFNNVAIDYILSTDGGSDVVVIYLRNYSIQHTSREVI